MALWHKKVAARGYPFKRRSVVLDPIESSLTAVEWTNAEWEAMDRAQAGKATAADRPLLISAIEQLTTVMEVQWLPAPSELSGGET